MAIATLIAAGRLEERLIGVARAALADAGIAVGSLVWIDRGDAADLPVEGDAALAHRTLDCLDLVDVAVREGERARRGCSWLTWTRP